MTDEESNSADPSETLAPRPGSEEEDESFRPFDNFAHSYQPSTIPKVTGEDGIPQHVDPGARGEDIPALSTESLVCMGDFSKFVTRDEFGQITREYTPEEVVQTPNGNWYLRNKEGFSHSQVQPLRPPCRHYERQVTQLEHNPEHEEHVRLCTARRTTSGAFMDVGNLAMWACTMREPRDVKSEKRIEEFDKKKISQGLTRVKHSIFSK